MNIGHGKLPYLLLEREPPLLGQLSAFPVLLVPKPRRSLRREPRLAGGILNAHCSCLTRRMPIL